MGTLDELAEFPEFDRLSLPLFINDDCRESSDSYVDALQNDDWEGGVFMGVDFFRLSLFLFGGLHIGGDIGTGMSSSLSAIVKSITSSSNSMGD